MARCAVEASRKLEERCKSSRLWYRHVNEIKDYYNLKYVNEKCFSEMEKQLTCSKMRVNGCANNIFSILINLILLINSYELINFI